MKTQVPALTVICLLGVPSVVLANAGTPLMWAGMLHLVFGNALIGIAEGAAIAALFRVPFARTIGLLVSANYVSAWIGGLFLRNAVVSHARLDLGNAWSFFWIMVAATFGITLLLEFPFVLVALWKKSKRFRKALAASLLVQSVSYALLFCWYWSVSGTSLYTETEVVELSTMALPANVRVFYISSEDGDVYMTSLRERDPSKIFDLDSSGIDDRLLFCNPHGGESPRELAARAMNDSGEASLIELGQSFPANAVPELDELLVGSLETEGNWFTFGPAARLGSAKDSPWEFHSGFWPVEGLRGVRDGGKNSAGFSYETPFGQWTVRNLIHLPTDKVLFQLGTDQICLFDPVARRVALVAKGRGPTAATVEDP